MKIIDQLEEYEEKEISDLLFGRTVEVKNGDELHLDNGMVLEVQPNAGCGGCNAGWYDLTEINGCENAITDVEFVEDDETEDVNDRTSYKIFVLTIDKRIKLLQVDGDDGNGYYGTGYSIIVKIKK